MPNYYATLGVPPDASDEAIVAAYLALIEEADEVTVAQAETALGVLTDPVQRAAYDAARRTRTTRPARPAAVLPRGARAVHPVSSTRPSTPMRPPVPKRPPHPSAPSAVWGVRRGPLFAGVGRPCSWACCCWRWC